MVREHRPASDRILAVDARLGAVPFIVAEGAGGQNVKVSRNRNPKRTARAGGKPKARTPAPTARAAKRPS
jgi:hypothetical protein